MPKCIFPTAAEIIRRAAFDNLKINGNEEKISMEQEGITIIGHIHRVSKDHDGEVTLVLKIPSNFKTIAINLPENTIMSITFKPSEDN